MDTVTATADDLIRVLEEAGTAFAWSRAYESVLSTAIGAAFQAAGLDEATDAIGVSPAENCSHIREYPQYLLCLKENDGK